MLCPDFLFTFRALHHLNLYTTEIYQKELTLKIKAKTNSFNCPFTDLDAYNFGKIDTKIYEKRVDLSYPIVNFSFLHVGVSLATSGQ